jgi:homoserine O-acetyltransferase
MAINIQISIKRAFPSLGVLIFCIPLWAQTSAEADYTNRATQGDYIVSDFQFHDGERLAQLRLHYASWGTPKRNAAGDVINAVLLLHGTLGVGIDWGHPYPASPQVHPLLGPGGALDSSEYFVIAPDTIGAGKSSRPSDSLRMKFPHYNLEDIVKAERLLAEHLGAKHLIAVLGASMGGRQTWQWGVQYPDFMDALVPMISSPFPNAGRRGLIDYIPEQIIKSDPEWKNGNYERNPDSARIADLTYSVFLRTPSWYQKELPTRDDVAKLVREGPGQFQVPDADDFIYMMELNDGFDAWSQLDRIKCPVLIINMAGDNMVPVELHDAEKAAARLKTGTYLEIKEEAEYGHGALGRTVNIWGPKLRDWLHQIQPHRESQKGP